MNLEEIVGFPFLMALIGWLSWLLFKKTQSDREERLKYLELQKEVVRKFTTSESMVEFVRSEEGRRCFPADPALHPRWRSLRAVSLGITLILIGIAMAAEGYSWRENTDMNYVNKMHDYLYWASVTGAAGTGLIVHALISLKLAKKWNLLRDDA